MLSLSKKSKCHTSCSGLWFMSFQRDCLYWKIKANIKEQLLSSKDD